MRKREKEFALFITQTAFARRPAYLSAPLRLYDTPANPVPVSGYPRTKPLPARLHSRIDNTQLEVIGNEHAAVDKSLYKDPAPPVEGGR